MAKCFEITLLPGIDQMEFENAMSKDVFPNLQILRRNVRETSHRLFKLDSAGTGDQRYIWLVLTALVGSTPETAGDGPEVLAADPPFLNEAEQMLVRFAKVSIFSEVSFAA